MGISGRNLLALASGGNLYEVTGLWSGSLEDGSPAEMVADILGTEGVATLGTTLFVGFMPETPDAAVACYDSGGLAPDAKWGLDRPAVNVRVRSEEGDYAAGWTKAVAVKNVLLGRPSPPYITMKGEIAHIGQDGNRRHLFTLNFLLMVEPETTGHRTVI